MGKNRKSGKNDYPGYSLGVNTKGNHDFFTDNEDGRKPLFFIKKTPKRGKPQYDALWLSKHASATIEDDVIVIRVPVKSNFIGYRTLKGTEFLG